LGKTLETSLQKVRHDVNTKSIRNVWILGATVVDGVIKTNAY